MDFVHRVMTGQTVSPTELRIAGLIVLAWLVFDVGWCLYDHLVEPSACVSPAPQMRGAVLTPAWGGG
jgi:hypothetical protein